MEIDMTHFLIHEADSQSWLVVIIISTHVCPPTIQNLAMQNKF